MSELKATTAQEIVRNEKDCDYMDELLGGVKMPPTQVYLKSEADKVIAELETRLSAIQSDKMQLEDDNALLRRNNAELREATRWRKCSEELPKDGETVLVLLGRTPKTRGFFLTSRYVAGGWTYGEDPQGCKPSHWMPLPSAPKEEK